MKTILDGKRWVAFYSRTGQEIVDLATRLDRIPDAIVTNVAHEMIREEVLALGAPMYVVPTRPTVDQYFAAIGPDAENTIVTLHGWLRIVPPEVCEQYEIYNGHPGLITQYPELKGFDPQEKAFNLGHLNIGSVVHRVTAGVDEGKIEMVTEAIVTDERPSLDSYYEILRETSMNSWYVFLTQGGDSSADE